MEPIRTAVSVIRFVTPTAGYLAQNFDRALHNLEYGAPVSASFECERADIRLRNIYNNHSTIGEHADTARKKIVSGAVNNCLIVLPRWVRCFIYGLILSSIGFILHKSKGHIVMEPSMWIYQDDDSGTLNDQMDKNNPVSDTPPSLPPHVLHDCAPMELGTHLESASGQPAHGDFSVQRRY